MSGGGKTQTSTSSVQIPPEVLARYNAVNARAENVASTPFQAYSYDPNAFVAPMTETQNAAIGQIGQASGMAQPYFQTGAAATLGGMGSANLGELDTNKYMSPYLQNVVQSTADILGQQNRQDMSGALGTAIQSGAGFGDRSGIAAANLNRQQMMGMGSTIGNLLNQGYTQAQGVAQQQQSADLAARQANLARLLQGGQNIGQLGAGAQGAALAGSQALLGAGTQEQQTEQAGKSALYNQYQQERAYPFQVSQFLGNLAMGTGALSGSTTQTTSPAGFFSGFKDGGKVIEGVGYRRGGLVPESMGGHVNAGHMGEGYADGGSPQTDYATMVMQQLFGGMDPNAGAYGRGSAGIGSGGFVPQANLPVGQLMIANPVEAPAQTNASDLVDMASSLTDTGEKAGDLWDEYGPKSSGGRTGLAAGGIPYDPSGSGYVPVQEPGTQKTPELLQPKDPQQPESGLSKVADIAKIVGMFMANGGVAGRRGYAGGGRPEDETGLTLEQELLEYARRRPASALYDPGQQNLPPQGVAVPARVQWLSFNPYASVQGSQAENAAYVAAARAQGLSFNPYWLSYDPGRQNLPPEGVTIPTPGREAAEAAEANFLKQLRAAPAGAAVTTTPGLSGADAERIRREYYTNLYADQPVEQITPTAGDMFRHSLEIAPENLAVATPAGLSAADAERIRGEYYTDLYKKQPVERFNAFGTPLPAGVSADAEAIAATDGGLKPAALPVRVGGARPAATEFPVAPAWTLPSEAAAITPAAAETPSGLGAASTVVPAAGAATGDLTSDALEANFLKQYAVATGKVPAAATPEGLAGAASPAVPAADATVAADAASGDLTSGVTPLTTPIDGATTAATTPVVEPQPGLAAGTGTGTPATDTASTVPAADAKSIYKATALNDEGTRIDASGDDPQGHSLAGFHENQFGKPLDQVTARDISAAQDKWWNEQGGDQIAEKYGANFAAAYVNLSMLAPATARRALKDAGGDPDLFFDKFKSSLMRLDKWEKYGKGWSNRIDRADALASGVEPQPGLASANYSAATNIPPIPMPRLDRSGLGAASTVVPAAGLGGGNFLDQAIAKAGGAENIILPFLSGIGKMAGSQSRFLGTAILEGVGGGAEAYMNRQKQLADIAQTQALTRGSDIQNVGSSVKEIGGVNYVVTANGGLQQFNDWLSNPSAPIAGGEALNNVLRLAGQQLAAQNGTANTGNVSSVLPRGVEGGAGMPVSPSQPPVPTNVPWDPRASEATDRADKLMSSPVAADLIKNSAALLNEVTAGGAIAGDNRLNIAEQAMAVSALMGAPPLESFGSQGTGRAAVTKALNLFSQSLGLGAFSDMPTQTDILDKLRFAQANNLVNASNQDSYNALSAAASMMPNIEQDPIAAATVMATLMVDNQRAIDRSSFYNAFADQTTSTILLPAAAEFNRLYDNVYKQEVAYLRDLMSNPQAAPYIQGAMEASTPEEAQRILFNAFGGKQIPPKLHRYFVAGGAI